MLVGEAWPSQQVLVQRYIDFTFVSGPPGPSHNNCVFYTETTQIVERLDATGLVLPPAPGDRRVLPRLGCAVGCRIYFIPALPKSALLGVVWKHLVPATSHPITLHAGSTKEWVPDATIIHNIWHTVRAVTLRFVWFYRNKCLFDGRRSTPTSPALMVIFSTSSAHLRHLLRRQYDMGMRKALQRATAALSRDASFDSFLKFHPAALVVRHRSDSFQSSKDPGASTPTPRFTVL
uniref:Uncharacterized protein n=1 Tax=Peronospora matthiolae TaxID=2874970 RepID=A0AAV1ULS9_9STRA